MDIASCSGLVNSHTQKHRFNSIIALGILLYLFRFAEVDVSISIIVQLAVDGLNGGKLQLIAQRQHLCMRTVEKIG